MALFEVQCSNGNVRMIAMYNSARQPLNGDEQWLSRPSRQPEAVHHLQCRDRYGDDWFPALTRTCNDASETFGQMKPASQSDVELESQLVAQLAEM